MPDDKYVGDADGHERKPVLHWTRNDDRNRANDICGFGDYQDHASDVDGDGTEHDERDHGIDGEIQGIGLRQRAANGNAAGQVEKVTGKSAGLSFHSALELTAGRENIAAPRLAISGLE
jgi:hypothetical protein